MWLDRNVALILEVSQRSFDKASHPFAVIDGLLSRFIFSSVLLFAKEFANAAAASSSTLFSEIPSLIKLSLGASNIVASLCHPISN